MSLVRLVSIGRQVARVGIQRLQKSMQRAVRHLGNVGLFDVLTTYAREYFTVNLQLAVRAVVRGGVHASQRTHNDEK